MLMKYCDKLFWVFSQIIFFEVTSFMYCVFNIFKRIQESFVCKQPQGYIIRPQKPDFQDLIKFCRGKKFCCFSAKDEKLNILAFFSFQVSLLPFCNEPWHCLH